MKMKNLRSFPMQKLSFDLKLEVLQQMGPRDVYELAKVNQGFQGMLVRDPSIVCGEHVFRIGINREKIRIQKSANSDAMELIFDRPFSHFSFVKKIRSCDHLLFWTPHQVNENYSNTLLKNLRSVNELLLSWSPGASRFLAFTAKELLEGFFSNFQALIKSEAKLNIYCSDSTFNDQVIKDRIGNFMVGPQLKDCEKISFDCRSDDSVRFCCNALSKAEIKNVAMRTLSRRCIVLLIQQIITNGIPSKHPEAAIFLDYNFDFKIDLSQCPGMRRIDGENRLRLLKQANDLARNFGYSGSLGFDCFREESSIFRRRFDATKDCICVYVERYARRFLAFYVPVN